MMKENIIQNILNEADFQKEVLENREPVVVEFGAEWCGTCHINAPVLEKFKKQIKIFVVNVDNNENLARAYAIQNIPTLLFFKNGEVVDHIIGAVPRKVLAAKLNDLFQEEQEGSGKEFSW